MEVIIGLLVLAGLCIVAIPILRIAREIPESIAATIHSIIYSIKSHRER